MKLSIAGPLITAEFDQASGAVRHEFKANRPTARQEGALDETLGTQYALLPTVWQLLFTLPHRGPQRLTEADQRYSAGEGIKSASFSSASRRRATSLGEPDFRAISA